MPIRQAAATAVRGRVLKLKSARTQAFLAGAVLLVLLVSVAALAVWRAQNDQSQKDRLEQRTAVATALDDARAQFFLGCTLIYNAIFVEDPRLAVGFYYQVKAKATEDVAQARAGLVAMGEMNEAAALDSFFGKILDLSQAVEQIAAAGLTADKDTRIALGQQYAPQSYHYYQTMMNDLEQLADGQRSKLADERAAAERASDYTFGLLIGLSLLAFLGAFAILGIFIVSLLRPLASLQASARAIISGNWEARAKVSGPEETASLARDFNEMTETLVERSALLEESEGRFRNVLDVSRDFIYKLNLETGTYDYVSPSVLRLTGFTPEELIAMGFKGVAERAHPEDKILLDMPFRMLLDLSSEDSSVARVEYRWKHKDGEYLWASDSRSLIRDENGRAIAVVGTVRDETKRKQAEEALRESEEKYRQLVENLQEGVWALDKDGHTTFANPRMAEMLGYTVDEMLGKHLLSFMDEQWQEVAKEKLERRRQGVAEQHDFEFLRKDGTRVYTSLATNPATDRNGNYIGALAAVTDITDKKQAEEALRKSEELFRTLSASAPVGIFLMDDKGQIIYTNERLQAIAGPIPQGSRNIDLVAVAHPDDRERMLAEATRQQEGPAEDSQEYRILTPQGETRWVHARVCPIFSTDGRPSGVVGTVEDTTAPKQAEEAMANRLRMEFAIAQASNLLAGPEDVDAVLNLALRILGEAFGADRAHIFLLRDNNTRMDSTSEWCAPGIAPHIDNLQDIDSTAFRWWIDRLSQNEPIIMNNTSAAPPEAALEKKSWKVLNIHSLLAVPLLSDGKPIGYVRFANMKSDSTEREEDIRLLRLASESIASFIERQRAGEDKRKAYESIVFLLATAAEARDPYTEDHLYRIRGFAEAIAAELGLPPDEIKEIGLSSLLHDLGKMRVPDSILTKPGPLSAAEWKIMKQHPLWGDELLSAHPWLETARQIARWHHERWDGTGYPDGLHAEQIPLGAAIVSVADSLDAMISERPYKGAWPQQQAVREIRMHKGRQYSPDVVEAFNRALRKGEIKRVTDATLRLSKLARAA